MTEPTTNPTRAAAARLLAAAVLPDRPGQPRVRCLVVRPAEDHGPREYTADLLLEYLTAVALDETTAVSYDTAEGVLRLGSGVGDGAAYVVPGEWTDPIVAGVVELAGVGRKGAAGDGTAVFEVSTA